MVRTYPPERIAAQIEVFDWMVARKDAKITRNPPGFLLAAIRDQYAPPRDFLDYRATEEKARKASEQKQRQLAHHQQCEAVRETTESERQQEILAFWSSLTEAERTKKEAEAIAGAPAFQRKLIARGGSSGIAAKKTALDSYALGRLQKA